MSTRKHLLFGLSADLQARPLRLFLETSAAAALACGHCFRARALSGLQPSTTLQAVRPTAGVSCVNCSRYRGPGSCADTPHGRMCVHPVGPRGPLGAKTPEAQTAALALRPTAAEWRSCSVLRSCSFNDWPKLDCPPHTGLWQVQTGYTSTRVWAHKNININLRIISILVLTGKSGYSLLELQWPSIVLGATIWQHDIQVQADAKHGWRRLSVKIIPEDPPTHRIMAQHAPPHFFPFHLPTDRAEQRTTNHPQKWYSTTIGI
ncbi:hypothetical protein DFH27DRAFT_523194 [Peziza echinospora]|nr:hypothetical protein DFH27DRAFT_523194 [Peziza echinospora]